MLRCDPLMSSSVELPSPLELPELPPEMQIAGEEELFFRTEDGFRIEALANLAPSAERVAVLCHPHPLDGGTMHNAIVVVLAKRLLERGQGRVGWIRFNYRGVGRSEGRYGASKAEVLDALAALAEARRRVAPARLSLAAYSFGTGVAYRAAIVRKDVDRVSLIAPSPRTIADEVGEYTGPVQLVAAGRDPYCTAQESKDLARRLGASLRVIEEAEHDFVRFRRGVANLAVPFIAPELAP